MAPFQGPCVPGIKPCPLREQYQPNLCRQKNTGCRWEDGELEKKSMLARLTGMFFSEKDFSPLQVQEAY